ncbi:tyrosine-type recombinase/integrase [Segetibacter koreensis]|uniref:tyrosine-type recombinase/integrase n=1 Tax=Segetibacter koreensis TaxID=398037 RepID=UPI0003635BAF|nr:site-specific integrase [Segetibacter koreensis]
MAIKVKLRRKPISGKRLSLYLDFYPAIINTDSGQLTRREFLGLYLFDTPKTLVDKQHNKETQSLAEQIRQKRDNQLNKPEIYTDFEREQLKLKEKSNQSFVEFFEKLANKKKTSNYDNWVSALKYLKRFTKGNLKFADLNESFCENFKDYLLSAPNMRGGKTPLSKNSSFSYFNKFKAALRQAYRDGYLQSDLNAKVNPLKAAETQRKFLTMEEVNQLAKTECTLPILKKAALFSAITGLRFSDIEKMVWSELEFIKGQGYFIHFRQEKSEGVEAMPISEQAFGLLGERKKPTERVFAGLVYSAGTNRHLFKWLTDAGITKKITFHSFRHTFATLQLSKGTDIYTVSKMLGHRDLKTTQVYAKIIDQTKREAADKIHLDL